MDMKNLNIKRVSVSLASKAITALFSISMLMTSCSEDNVINLKPINQIAEDEAFSTPSLILAAVNGVYKLPKEVIMLVVNVDILLEPLLFNKVIIVVKM